MKDRKRLVPKRRFKEFKYSEEWEEKKLLDLAEFNPKEELPISFKYIDLESVVGTSLISYKEEDRETAPSRAQRLARQGDVFYQTVRPYQKNNYLFTKPCKNYVFSTGYTQMRPSGDSFFLLSLIQNNRFLQLVLDRCTGTSYPAISSNDLKEIEIISPDYNEQTKIGKFFQQLDNLISLQQEKIRKTKAIKSAYLSEMFPKEGEKYPKLRFEEFTEPWEERKLNLLAERFDNLRIPVTASNRISGKTPYYGANGILDYVDGFTHDGEYILIAEDGANDLNDYPVHYVNGRVWVNNHAHVIQARQGISDNKFLQYSFKTLEIKPYLVGGSRAKLNADVLMELILYTPKLDEQIKLGQFFQNLDKQVTLHEKKLEKLENLKKAYLNEMFV